VAHRSCPWLQTVGVWDERQERLEKFPRTQSQGAFCRKPERMLLELNKTVNEAKI
jgi:hypothetical protein